MNESKYILLTSLYIINYKIANGYASNPLSHVNFENALYIFTLISIYDNRVISE